MNKHTKSAPFKGGCSVIFLLVGMLTFQVSFALTAPSLGDVASTIIQSFDDVAKFITASFYLLGTGFIGSAIFKFRAHKDNPTQIPVGTPIALMFIGAAFLYTHSLFGTAGMTLFGAGAETAGVTGTDTFGQN